MPRPLESVASLARPDAVAHESPRRRRIHTVYARRVQPGADPGRPKLLHIYGYYHGRRKFRGSGFDGDLYWTADLVRR